MQRVIYLLLVVLLISGFGQPLLVAEETVDAEQVQVERWMKFYTAEASQYEMLLGDDAETKLELHPHIIYRYTNPIRLGQHHGATFLWTHQGRPQVIGAIWSKFAPERPHLRRTADEFHSLSTKPITSRHEQTPGRSPNVPNWKVDGPGIEWKTISDVPAPAGSAPQRLTQMRRMAEQFTVEIVPNEIEDGQELRRLTQPLHRYSSAEAGVLDGCLFAFVTASDPEAVLLFEASESEKGPRWQYALARFTNFPLRARRNGQEVWSCEQAEPFVGHQPYFIYWGVSYRDPIIPPDAAADGDQ